MTLVDEMRFIVLANGSDVTSRFKQATVNVGNSEIPTLNITFDNSGNFFTGSTPLFPNLPLVLSGSIDGGTTWTKLFSGSVANKTLDRDGYGERVVSVNANGANSLRLLYLSPNQEILTNCDIGQVFTGSQVNRVGFTWSGYSDGKGNYPDGLLYKSGYSLSADSVKDIFVGVPDIPLTIILSKQSAWDAITSLAKTYGLMVFVDDVAGTLRVLQDTALADFPTYSLTLNEKTDISSIELSDECLEQYDKITVIGKTNDLFYTVGSGTREKIIQDDTLTDRKTTILKAKQLYSIYSQPKRSITVTTSPRLEPIIGRHISLSCDTMPTLDYGNVVGVKHNISSNRWDTVLTLETPTRTNTKMLADVKKELQNQKSETGLNKSVVHITGERSPNANYYGSYKSIVAVGYGTASSADISYLYGVKRIKPIKSLVYDTASNHMYVYASFDSNDPPCEIRGIALYANTSPTTSSNIPITRFHKNPYIRVGPPSYGSWVPIHTTSDYVTHIGGVCGFNAENDYSWYWQKPVKATLVGGYKWTNSAGADNYLSISHPTSSIWEGSMPAGAGYTGTTPTAEDKLKASIDDPAYTAQAGFSWDTADIPRDPALYSTHFAKMFEFDFGIASGAQKAVSYVCVAIDEATVYKTYIAPDYLFTYGTSTAFKWNPNTNAWNSISIAGNGIMSYASSGVPGDTNSANWISDDGKVRIALYGHCVGGVGDPSDPNTGSVHRVGYVGCTIRANSRLSNVREKFGVATYDAERSCLIIDGNPLEVTGIYTASYTTTNMRGGSGANQIAYLGYNLTTNKPYITKGPNNTSFVELRAENESGEYTEVNSGPLFNYLQTAGAAYVTYMECDTISIPPPQTVPSSELSLSYSDSGAGGVFYMKNTENAPAYRCDLRMDYYRLGTGSMICKFTSSANSRIPAGIMKDSKNQIMLMVDLNLNATTSANGTFSGIGCVSPV